MLFGRLIVGDAMRVIIMFVFCCCFVLESDLGDEWIIFRFD